MSFTILQVLMSVALAAGSSAETLDIGPVWSAHPVGFSLYTHNDWQFVAYYDANRQMTVASRKLDAKSWTTFKLPEKLKWDSHNSVTLAVDDLGYVHVSGNMHCVPLVYFRTARPLDIESFERAGMIGTHEDKCTYPRFFRGPGQTFIFTYRDGRSGNGDQIFNVHDAQTRSWRRLLDKPLSAGQGKMNAYFAGPVQGPDDRFHMCWVWRDTPDCETNHDISYARSADLVHWETIAGEPLTLPITIGTAEVVDPVPPGGGVINGGVHFGFDSQKRVVVSYHKFDESGNTQLYAARFEEGEWRRRQVSHWDYRWYFTGRGSIVSEITLSAVSACGEGRLELPYRHVKFGSGKFILDEETFAVLDTVKNKAGAGPKPAKTRSRFPGMQIRQANDSGGSSISDARYVLEWETLGPNRDRPRPEPWPEPSMLRVVKYAR